MLRTVPQAARDSLNVSPQRGAATYRRACLAAAVMGLCGTAQAAISDTVHPYVSAVYSYDDNLLRLPDNVDGPAGRADSIVQTQVGLIFERPIGRQLLKADAKISRVTFQHYDELNYNGKDLSAEWQWAILNDFTGHLGAVYSETLTPFTDFHTSDRNLRTSHRSYADGAWRFMPSWQLHTALSRNQFNYDLSSQRFSDRTEDVTDLGIDYLAASGSRIGLLTRHTSGRYPNKQVFGSVVLDNGYQQDELKANIYWLLNGVTQVQVLAGWAKRKHDFFSGRDSSGVNGRVNGFWVPTGQVKLTAAVWREFSAVESSLVNNSLNKGASVSGTWQTTAKLVADAELRRETRNFSISSIFALPGDASDSAKRMSAGLTYSPTETLQFNLNAYREIRTGNPYVGTGSYTSKGASLSATGQF